MTAGLEVVAIAEWLDATLRADGVLQAALGTPDEIYADTLPPDVTYPYVFFQHQTNADTTTVEEITVLVRASFIIKGVDRAESYAGLVPIYARIHTLLHRAAGTVVDGQVLFCARAQTIMYPEFTEQVSYRHLGGVYRLWTQA